MAIDRDDLERTFREDHVRFYNFTLRWVFDEKVAEDLIQEAFIRVWQKRDQIEKATLRSYLFRCLQNLSINYQRRKKMTGSLLQTFSFMMGGLEWEESPVKNDRLLDLQKKLEKIPLKYREVLLLFYFSGMTTQEIAKTLEIAEGTVSSRKSRALELLKGEIHHGGAYVY
ncbi:MAG: RNA polymerase sigma factor [Pseudomonadota bacterium]